MEVMKPASKNKTWANDDMPIDHTAVPAQDSKVEPVHVDEAESDDEYQTVQKKAKRTEPVRAAETSDITVPATQSSGDNVPEDQQVNEYDGEQQVETQPLSDADWLRSRTSRKLGLVDDDDDDEELTHRPKPSEKEDVSASEEDQQEADVDIQAPAASLPAAGNKTENQVSSDIESIRHTGRLFLRNLSYDISEDDLRGHFDSFGILQEVRSFPHSFFPTCLFRDDTR